MRKPASRSSAEPVKPRGATRKRVLDAALALFNERGFERVTTRLIAEAVGINEGNLYYHFRTKEALVLALFDGFAKEASALARPSGDDRSSLAPHLGALERWFDLTWRYRLLFRDTAVLKVAAPELPARLRALSLRLEDDTRRSLSDLVEAGLMAIPPDLNDILLANVWIVASYWISYLVLHREIDDVASEHLLWGYRQVLGLFLPYLTPAGLAALASLPEPTFPSSGLAARISIG